MIKIRKLNIKDAKALEQMNNDKEITWSDEKGNSPKSLIEWRKEVKKLLKIEDCYQLSILYDKKFVGMLSIEKIDKIKLTANIGYWIAKSYRNKGIATNAIKLATSFIFRKLKLNKIYAEVGKNNIPSIKVLKKAGFSKETRYYANRKKTEHVYVITKHVSE